MRVDRHKPILEHMISGWYPVNRKFDFIHAYTDPLNQIPLVKIPRKRDAIVKGFADTKLSAYIRVEVLPHDPGEADHLLLNTEVVVSVGPDYCVRTAIYPLNPSFFLRTQTRRAGEVPP